MWGGDCRKFLNDELGGGTVMGLLWIILLVGIVGLAVDTINGLRIRAMLQATADADTDAAALGGAIDLPATLYGSMLKAGVPEE